MNKLSFINLLLALQLIYPNLVWATSGMVSLARTRCCPHIRATFLAFLNDVRSLLLHPSLGRLGKTFLSKGWLMCQWQLSRWQGGAWA